MDDYTNIADLVDEVIKDHEAGIIAEEKIEEKVMELVRIIEHERSEGRLDSEEPIQSRDQLFSMLCLKDYLDQCEPVNCVSRITGTCEYIATLQKINPVEGRRTTP